MIKSVKGFGLECYFMYDGNLFIVTKFPTRSMVCGDLVHKFIEPCPFQVKVLIKEVDQLEKMDWNIQDAKEVRKAWLKDSKAHWGKSFKYTSEEIGRASCRERV